MSVCDNRHVFSKLLLMCASWTVPVLTISWHHLTDHAELLTLSAGFDMLVAVVCVCVCTLPLTSILELSRADEGGRSSSSHSHC